MSRFAPMTSSASVFEISPAGYEQVVKDMLDTAAGSQFLEGYSSSHLEPIRGADGEYIFDVTARFRVMGADFLVLVECKRHRRKVERQDVQVLQAKVQSVGANKGMLFSTAGFQDGAVTYARSHGISLVRLDTARTEWVQRGDNTKAGHSPADSLASASPYCGIWLNGSDDPLPLSTYRSAAILAALGLAEGQTHSAP